MVGWNAARRDLLKLSTMGVAGAAIPAALVSQTPTAACVEGRCPVPSMYGSMGPKGDGKALDTPAIQRAIDAAATAGGGTVVFTPAPISRSLCG